MAPGAGPGQRGARAGLAPLVWTFIVLGVVVVAPLVWFFSMLLHLGLCWDDCSTGRQFVVGAYAVGILAVYIAIGAWGARRFIARKPGPSGDARGDADAGGHGAAASKRIVPIVLAALGVVALLLVAGCFGVLYLAAGW